MLHIVKNQHIIDEVITYISIKKEMIGCENSVLLVEEAVYLANPRHKDHSKLDNPIFNGLVLKEDLQARGMMSLVSPNIQLVDFNGFVDLTTQHQQSITWE